MRSSAAWRPSRHSQRRGSWPCWAPGWVASSSCSTTSLGCGSAIGTSRTSPAPAVEGHAGELVAGRIGGTPAILLFGRAHPYEGYTQREATLLLRAVIALGVDTVVLTNAAGGLNPEFDPGDVMLITDHINLSGDNPLPRPEPRSLRRALPATDRRVRPRPTAPRRSKRESGSGWRCARASTSCFRAFVRDPCRDAHAPHARRRRVGMSTAHETIVARHAGARVLGFSLITNKATDDVETGATHEEVIEMGRVGAERARDAAGRSACRGSA